MEDILKSLKFGVSNKNSIKLSNDSSYKKDKNQTLPINPQSNKANKQLNNQANTSNINSEIKNTISNYNEVSDNIINIEDSPEIIAHLFPNCEDYTKEINSLQSLKDKLIKKSKHKSNKDTESSDKVNEIKIEKLEKKKQEITNELFSKLNLQVSSAENFKETDTLPLCSFKDIQNYCNLDENFSKVIDQQYNYKTPSPVQSCVIPFLYNQDNIVATSSTGSGKTLSFVIPVISTLINYRKKGNDRKALVVAPTKELCTQIYNEFNILSAYYNNSFIKTKLIKHDLLISCNSSEENFHHFIDNQDVFIGTPDNILSFLTKSADPKYLIKKLKFIIFDEADKMFEKSFNSIVQDILNKVLNYERKILKVLKEKVSNSNKSKLEQTLDEKQLKLLNKLSINHRIVKCFFSATLSTEIFEYLNSQIVDIKLISIGNNSLPCTSVQQKFKYCTNYEGKIHELKTFLKNDIVPPVLVFVDSIESGKRLFEKIKIEIPKISLLHSKMSKEGREDLIKKLRVHDIWVLITSDLIARGIDFKNIKTVINFDCPEDYVNYIHRVGRTGRAGTEGSSITYISDDDRYKLRKLKKILNESKEIDCPNWMKNVK